MLTTQDYVDNTYHVMKRFERVDTVYWSVALMIPCLLIYLKKKKRNFILWVIYGLCDPLTEIWPLGLADDVDWLTSKH